MNFNIGKREFGVHFGKPGILSGKRIRWYGIATPWYFFGVLRLMEAA